MFSKILLSMQVPVTDGSQMKAGEKAAGEVTP